MSKKNLHDNIDNNIDEYLHDEYIENIKTISIDYLVSNIFDIAESCIYNNAFVVFKYILTTTNIHSNKYANPEHLLNIIIKCSDLTGNYDVLSGVIEMFYNDKNIFENNITAICKNINIFNIFYDNKLISENNLCKCFQWTCRTGNLLFVQYIYSKIINVSLISISNCFVNTHEQIFLLHNVIFNPNICIKIYDWLFYVANSYFTNDNINKLFIKSDSLSLALWLSNKGTIDELSYVKCIENIQYMYNGVTRKSSQYLKFINLVDNKHKLLFLDYLYEKIINASDMIMFNLNNIIKKLFDDAVSKKNLCIAEFLINHGFVVDDFKHVMYDYYTRNKHIQRLKLIRNTY